MLSVCIVILVDEYLRRKRVLSPHRWRGQASGSGAEGRNHCVCLVFFGPEILEKETSIEIRWKSEERADALGNPAIKSVDEGFQAVLCQVSATSGTKCSKTAEVFAFSFACALASNEQSRDCSGNVCVSRKSAKAPINRARKTANAQQTPVESNSRFELRFHPSF